MLSISASATLPQSAQQNVSSEQEQSAQPTLSANSEPELEKQIGELEIEPEKQKQKDREQTLRGSDKQEEKETVENDGVGEMSEVNTTENGAGQDTAAAEEKKGQTKEEHASEEKREEEDDKDREEGNPPVPSDKHEPSLALSSSTLPRFFFVHQLRKKGKYRGLQWQQPKTGWHNLPDDQTESPSPSSSSPPSSECVAPVQEPSSSSSSSSSESPFSYFHSLYHGNAGYMLSPCSVCCLNDDVCLAYVHVMSLFLLFGSPIVELPLVCCCFFRFVLISRMLFLCCSRSDLRSCMTCRLHYSCG